MREGELGDEPWPLSVLIPECVTPCNLLGFGAFSRFDFVLRSHYVLARLINSWSHSRRHILLLDWVVGILARERLVDVVGRNDHHLLDG